MTFKHKLSVRLALLKDVRPLIPVLVVLAACELPGPVAPPITTNINVSTIVTVPASITLDPGENQQFVSYGRTPDGDSVAVNVKWLAVGGGSISGSGLYTAGTLQGDYAVKATLIPPEAIGAPVTAVPVRTSVVHVDPLAQIVAVPESTSVVTGGTRQFAAYGRRSAGDSVALSVVWSATGGTISSSGLYTAGPTPGGYVVNASAEGLSGTATVTTSSVAVDTVIVSPPDSVNLSLGSTQQFTAVVMDASGNVLTGRSVTWETSNSAVATVSPSGLVSGVGVGSATITATSEGKKGKKNAKVSNLPVASVTVSPNPATVYLGATLQLVATPKDANGHPLSGRTVTWTTSDGTVAAVDGIGLVSGIALGTATITATSEGQAGTTTVSVSSVPVASVVVAPSVANILAGSTVQLTATTLDAAGTVLAGRAITWSSSNPSVATVSSTGLATGIAAGTATITATSEGKNASAAVSVANVPVASVVISPATALVLVGASVQLVASTKDAAGTVLSGRAITWASSAPATATVSATGLVTGVAAGAVTITATSEGIAGSAAVTVNVVPVASVSISPATLSAAVGQAVQLTATLRDASGNPLSGRVVTWATSNAAVATVTASGQVTVGVVTGVAAGSATITATCEGRSGTAAVTVTLVPVASVVVSPATANLAVRGTVQLSVTLKDASGNTLTGRPVTWASSAPTVASVSQSGLVTDVADGGTATIAATSEGKTGSAAVTVVSAVTGTYYVAPTGSDANPGSVTAPFRSIQRAANLVNPGDVVIVEDGVYTDTDGDQSIVVVGRGGTAAAPVTFRARNKWMAKLDGQNGAAFQGFYLTSGIGYVRIEGFEIYGVANAGTGPTGRGSAAAIDLGSGGHDSWIVGNHIHDIGRVCTTSTQTNGLDGIFVEQPNITIEQNLIHDIGRFSPGENGCSYPSGWTVYQTNDHGIYVDGAVTPGASGLVIRNNIFYNTQHGWAVHMYPGTLSNVQVVNNTFAFGNPYYAYTHIVLDASISATTIANNIFYNPQGGESIDAQRFLGTITIRNNLTNGSAMIDVPSTPAGMTLTANLINTDPGLVNPPFDFHLGAGSPAIDAGLTLPLVSVDFDGVARPRGAGYDIGAYEF